MSDPTAKAFLVSARESETSDVQWLESIASSLSSQAPRFWMDHHYEEFVDKISLVAISLTDARRRHYARAAFGEADVLKMSRITMESQGQTQIELFVSKDELDNQSDATADDLLALLAERYPNSASRQKQIALFKAMNTIVILEGDTDG